jgi:hypothetical protein
LKLPVYIPVSAKILTKEDSECRFLSGLMRCLDT